MRKLYTFDKELLAYKRVNMTKVILICLFSLASIITLCSFICRGETKYVKTEAEIILKKNDEFSKEKLVQLIKDLKIKQPHIALAQMEIESGHFKSNLFKTQSNLLGMRYPTSRPTTALREERGYAYYKNWRDCVIDYSIYQASFLRDATEEEYYQYLQQFYAEDGKYVEVIKKHIKKNRLKELFK